MHQPGTSFTIVAITVIFSCFSFLGCSAPAPIHQPGPDSSQDNNTNSDKPSNLYPGEGLWPVSELSDSLYNHLQSGGLQLTKSTIYHPDSSSLSNAVAKINSSGNHRGSGAFISNQGLLITNFRTALNGIAGNSSLSRNHLKEGFLAQSPQQEIPLPNYQLRILIEQKEVTQQINRQLADSLTYREKLKQIQKITSQLINRRKNNNKNLIVEVNDFWDGNKQIMSVYHRIDDVRLVHSPSKTSAFPKQNSYQQPWPSHAADYALLRAYVGPEGNSRSYQASNIPFRPQHHLKINPSDIQQNQYTITLGYPGQTHRQESSYAVTFYQKHRNPIFIDTYEAIIEANQNIMEGHPGKAIAKAPAQMSATQNFTYFTQLQSAFQRDKIQHQKAEWEQQFQQWIKEDSLRNIHFRRVLPQLEQAYRIASQNGALFFALVNTFNNSTLFQIAGLYHSYTTYVSDSTHAPLSQKDKSQLLNRHRSLLNNIDKKAQNQLLGHMLYTLSTLPEGQIVFPLLELFGDQEGKHLENAIQSFLGSQKHLSLVYDIDMAKHFLQLPADSIQEHPGDALVKLYGELLQSYEFSRKNFAQHLPYLRPAQERYTEGFKAFLNDPFPYPDANETLRLTVGGVEGFNSTDGIPLPAITRSENHTANFLSTNDITGGGYGSPVLNNEGALIGLTSYRTAEGIGSDFIFNPKLHRTINVSAQYIINQISEFSGSHKLLKEMQF